MKGRGKTMVAVLQVRMTRAERDALDVLCAETRCSASHWIRLAIAEAAGGRIPLRKTDDTKTNEEKR